MAAVVVILIMVVHSFQLTTQQGVDRTLQREASGADVVRAVANKIQVIFGDDKQFLRRIAFVESKDGTDSNTYRSGYHGGIWQVDEIAFRDTQDTASHPGLFARYGQIRNEFGINWADVEWSDLRIPLYSGLAARLFLLNIPGTIPCDVAGQAAYWKRHYNTFLGAGTEQKFIEDVQALDRDESCRVNSDIMLVLDASGSIGRSNFNNVREFVLDYVNSLTIGPNDNQVGVITFSDTARIEFDLGTYSDSDQLRQAVRGITYTDGGTNIPDALCALITSFKSGRSDSSVFRVAILMTDGVSNTDGNACGFRTVSEAANAVRAISPPVLVFGFGVGSNYSPQDVTAIASGPEFVSSAVSFISSQLDCVQTTQENQICNSISTPVELEAENRGSLEQGDQIRWQVDVPASGRLFTLQVDQGEVALYASTETTAPNEAFYQWKIQTSSSDSVFIKPTTESDSDSRKRSVVKQTVEINNVNETLVPVYTTISGLESNNTFTLTGAARRLNLDRFLLVAAAALLKFLS